MFFFKYHTYLLLFLFIISSNCQLKEPSQNHGILFLENRSNKLVISKSNKNDVISIIGQPHSKSINNENEWLYFERIFTKGKYHKLGRHVLKENNSLILNFDKFGILVSKKLVNKQKINKVAFSNEKTENQLSKKSFVESFLSSVREKMYGNRK